LTGLEIAERMKVAYGLFEPLIVRLRTERLIEVRGCQRRGEARAIATLSPTLDAPAPCSISRSTSTRRRAGAARGLRQADEGAASARGFIDRERLRKGFSHLIIGDGILEKLGPAANANKALFSMGLRATARPSSPEGLGRALGGDMYMPYAIDVDGHIITMFDPINHDRLDEDEPDPDQHHCRGAARPAAGCASAVPS
jgi:hypothetical protein